MIHIKSMNKLILAAATIYCIPDTMLSAAQAGPDFFNSSKPIETPGRSPRGTPPDDTEIPENTEINNTNENSPANTVVPKNSVNTNFNQFTPQNPTNTTKPEA
jgi:hypothetical protein